MKKEMWKEVEGFDGVVLVSNRGRVKTIARLVPCRNGAKRRVKENIVAPYVDNRGYVYSSITYKGKSVLRSLPATVSKAFLPNPGNFTKVKHIDGNRSNNDVSNLKWCDSFIASGVKDLPTEVSDPTFIRWRNMLNRCSKGGASMCESWKTFSKFKKWVDKNDPGGYYLSLAVYERGNTHYSPTKCAMVPSSISNLLKSGPKKPRKLPKGVGRVKTKKVSYKATITRIGEGTVFLGTYNTVEEASKAYRKAKEEYVRSEAKLYYLTKDIPFKVYKALRNFKEE